MACADCAFPPQVKRIRHGKATRIAAPFAIEMWHCRKHLACGPLIAVCLL
jgi:hypothetical protein